MPKHDVYELVPAPKGRKIIGLTGRHFQDQGSPDGQIRNEGPGRCFVDFEKQVPRDRLKGTLNINPATYIRQRHSTAIRVCRQPIGNHTRHWKSP